MKSGQTETMILAQGHQKPYPGLPISTPKPSEAQVLSSVAKEPPRKITPIPAQPILQPAEILQNFRQRGAIGEKQVLEMAEEMRKEKVTGATQVAKRFLCTDVDVVEEKSDKTKETSAITKEAADEKSGEASQPTIGSTTISSRGNSGFEVK